MEDGPPRFGQGSTCPDLLGNRRGSPYHSFRLRDFHPLWFGIPTDSAKSGMRLRPVRTGPTACPATPYTQRVRPLTRIGFGLLRVRSPLLAESRLISFPPATEMFQFAGLAPSISSVTEVYSAGLPHSEIPGSKLACQLPEAYRRLPRPSSPLLAKASTTRP